MLADGEKTQAWLEIDLDPRLQFASGAGHRHRPPPARPRTGRNAAGSEWPLRAGLNLNHHDHAGVGTLELLDEQGRLACWRYTLGAQPGGAAPDRRVRRCIATASRTGQPVLRSTDDICPKCKAPLPPGEDECPICTREATRRALDLDAVPPVALRPPLPLAAAQRLPADAGGDRRTLVPPYLTMPLMDKVLIPFQNGKPIDCAAGHAAISAACSAPRCWPGCSAGRAPTSWRWCRERIGADLRTTTYEHLLRPVARILRRQAHRRPDGAHRHARPTASASSCRCTCSISPPTC